MTNQETQCATVPLIELLRKIPVAQRLEWTEPDGLKATHFVPVGRYAHEAADELEHREKYAEQMNEVLKENERLQEILKEAREMVEHWAGYASEYFKDKHNLAGDLAKLDAAIKAAEDGPAARSIPNIDSKGSGAVEPCHHEIKRYCVLPAGHLGECLSQREVSPVEPTAEYPAYEPCECGCHKTGLLCQECCGGPPSNLPPSSPACIACGELNGAHSTDCPTLPENPQAEPACSHSSMRRVDGHICEGCGGYRSLDEPDAPLQRVNRGADT